MNPSSTTNPIHFEDLDPRRFECLCFDILNRLYKWKRLDHTGAHGCDGGVDIFGITVDGVSCYCQVKRYKSIDSKEISEIFKKITENNSIDSKSCIILFVACNPSLKGLKTFYSEAVEMGFEEARLIGATSLESELYINRDLLEKYFGVNKRGKSKSRESLIKDNLRKKRIAEKKLLIKPSNNFRPKTFSDYFVDSEMILLSAKASMVSDRYNTDEASWIKAYPYRMQETGIDFIMPWYTRIAINTETGSWRKIGDNENVEKNEGIFLCQPIGQLPYSLIIDIEDGDGYFSCPILHCDVDEFTDTFNPFSYRCYEANFELILHDYCKIETYEIDEILNCLKNRKATGHNL